MVVNVATVGVDALLMKAKVIGVAAMKKILISIYVKQIRLKNNLYEFLSSYFVDSYAIGFSL